MLSMTETKWFYYIIFTHNFFFFLPFKENLNLLMFKLKVRLFIGLKFIDFSFMKLLQKKKIYYNRIMDRIFPKARDEAYNLIQFLTVKN